MDSISLFRLCIQSLALAVFCDMSLSAMSYDDAISSEADRIVAALNIEVRDRMRHSPYPVVRMAFGEIVFDDSLSRISRALGPAGSSDLSPANTEHEIVCEILNGVWRKLQPHYAAFVTRRPWDADYFPLLLSAIRSASETRDTSLMMQYPTWLGERSLYNKYPRAISDEQAMMIVTNNVMDGAILAWWYLKATKPEVFGTERGKAFLKQLPKVPIVVPIVIPTFSDGRVSDWVMGSGRNKPKFEVIETTISPEE